MNKWPKSQECKKGIKLSVGKEDFLGSWVTTIWQLEKESSGAWGHLLDDCLKVIKDNKKILELVGTR